MRHSSTPMLPGGSLIAGHLSDYRRDQLQFLRRAAEHGEQARARFGAFELRFINAPRLVQEALVDRELDYVKSYGLTLFAGPLLGDGLLTSRHDKHRRQRKLLAPAFTPRRIASYAETMVDSGERGLRRMLARGSVDLATETMQTTLEIAAKTLFDADIAAEADLVGDALSAAMEAIIGSMTATIPLPPPLPTPLNLRVARATRQLDRVVYAMIAQRKQSGEDRGDMLSLLLAARDEDGKPMSDQQVRDESMTAFLAGHETTANALAWTLYLLARHPALRDEVEAELDAVLAGRAPTAADLPRLPATLRALKESMRLYPPAFVTSRRVLHPTTLDGEPLPRNRVVVINIYGMHHHPGLFEDPQAFRPRRFLDEASWPRHAYMPFGAGPRMCIGNHFAWMETQLLLASWLSRARFSLASTIEAECDPLITLRPRPPLTMHVSPRQPRAVAIAN